MTGRGESRRAECTVGQPADCRRADDTGEEVRRLSLSDSDPVCMPRHITIRVAVPAVLLLATVVSAGRCCGQEESRPTNNRRRLRVSA